MESLTLMSQLIVMDYKLQ